jgi:hypothetical protein
VKWWIPSSTNSGQVISFVAAETENGAKISKIKSVRLGIGISRAQPASWSPEASNGRTSLAN